jgi:AcrR family transcriptional regulator
MRFKSQYASRVTVERTNQKGRTRDDLLRAAARLMQAGRSPSLEEVAEAAMVSRATAYRYFPGVEALLGEAARHVAMPGAESFFAGDASSDPLERLLRADAALAAAVRANAPALRALLARRLLQGQPGGERHEPLISAALAPGRAGFAPWAHDRLVKALALVSGAESIIGRSLPGSNDEEADAVRRWTIRALVQAAQRA